MAAKSFTVMHGSIRLKVKLLPTTRDVHRAYQASPGGRARPGKIVHAFFRETVAGKHVGTVFFAEDGKHKELVPHEVSHAVISVLHGCRHPVRAHLQAHRTDRGGSMNPTRCTNFRCGDCGEIYGSEDSALACCAPKAEEVKCWKCAECGDEMDDEDMARYCCLDEDVVLPPTPEQLEAAGQQRLPLCEAYSVVPA